MSPRGQVQNEMMRSEAVAKISGAALEVFAEYGYHGATMKQIAQRTGLSYGLVYHYFPSKEQLFLHLVDYALETSTAVINEALQAPGTAWEKLENLSALLVKNALTGEASRYFFIMLQALTQARELPGLHDTILARTGQDYAKLVPLIVQAQASGEAAPGDPTALAAAYCSYLQGLSLLAFQGTGIEQKITPDMLLNALRKGAARK